MNQQQQVRRFDKRQVLAAVLARPQNRYSQARYDFWSNSDKWPSDAPGHVFLARAVLQLGKAHYGSYWTGEEPFSVLPDPLPTTPDHWGHRQSAYEVLQALVYPTVLPPITKTPRFPPNIPISKENYAAMVKLLLRVHEQSTGD